MKDELRNRKVIVKGREVFIGVDVHKVSWHVTARKGGEEVFHRGISGQYAALRELLDRFKGCQIKVAYEAGPCGFWLHDQLREDGIEVIIAPPSLIPIESAINPIRKTGHFAVNRTESVHIPFCLSSREAQARPPSQKR